MLVFIAAYPFQILGLLQDNQAILALPKIKQRYSSAYTGLRLNSRSALCYTTVFCYRRLAIAVLILMQDTCPGLQIPMFVAQQLLYMSYLAHFKPCEAPFQNKLEMVGETCILVLSWILTVFNAGNTVDQQESAGVLFCVLIALTLFGHLVVLMIMSFRAFKKAICKKR